MKKYSGKTADFSFLKDIGQNIQKINPFRAAKKGIGTANRTLANDAVALARSKRNPLLNTTTNSLNRAQQASIVGKPSIIGKSQPRIPQLKDGDSLVKQNSDALKRRQQQFYTRNADRYSTGYSTNRSNAAGVPAIYPNARDLRIVYSRDRTGQLAGRVA